MGCLLLIHKLRQVELMAATCWEEILIVVMQEIKKKQPKPPLAQTYIMVNKNNKVIQMSD